MEKTTAYEGMRVWQKADEFVLSVYKIAETFPKHELFGLTAHYRRAAVSIAAIIAGGYKKRGFTHKLNFLNIAHSSLEEFRYYGMLSRDLDD